MGGNEKQPILRSINNKRRSFVRFVNVTAHNVRLYWIDYEGQPVSYGVLAPRHGYIDINTFVSHPWIFVNEETTERYVVNQHDVFIPGISVQLANPYAFITEPIYTLRELALRAIKKRLRYDWEAFKLEIPRSLQLELAEMLPKKETEQEDS